jgi:ferredoxin
MSTRVDPGLMKQLNEYGGINVDACFNCGNCTAICSMTTEEESFPRTLIRYAQVGMEKELVGSKELWLCYNCGECSETCPRQAEPARFMMAARCYAITSYDLFGLSKLMCRSSWLAIIFSILLAVILGLFMYTQTATMPTESLKLFEFISYEFIHNAGLIAMIVLSVIGLIGISRMIISIGRINNLSWRSFIKGEKMNWWGALWESMVVQALGQKRYRVECEDKETGKSWYISKWFVHAATMWGFLGLLAATGLDWVLDIVGLKPTGTFVPIWYPVRLLGTIAGMLFVYGVTVLIIKRLKQTDAAHSDSRTSDWLFLVILWLAGVTGFIIEIGLYLPEPPMWGYWMFLFHVAVSMELLLLLPFSKFGHAIYRIVALYILALKPIHETEAAITEPAGAD